MFLFLVLWDDALALRRLSLVSSSSSLSETVSTLGAFVTKLGDCLGGGTLGSAGGLGDVNGGGRTLGYGITLGTSSGSVGKR